MENTKDYTFQQRILKIINLIRIEKNGKNTFSNYDYFKPEEIYKRVNPLLEEYDIFPHFTTYFKEISLMEEDKIENGVTTTYGQKEIAKLELIDALHPETKVIYEIPLDILELKGTNKMQSRGGARTYAKRYLYMEAFNISDNKLDLDSDDMQDKKKMKKPSDDEKIQKVIENIKIKVDALKKGGTSPVDIAAAIKKVYMDNGKPSANYSTCQNVEDANRILKALEEI